MGIVTDKGLEYIAKLINGVSVDGFCYMATGTGSGVELYADTALGSENTLYGSARTLATCTYLATGNAKWDATFNFTGDVTVREIGIFNSNGDMLYRRLLSGNRYYHDGDAGEFVVTMTFERV
jgi:hypothetical protein